MRAFIALKQYVIMNEGREQQIRMILDRLDEHDVQLNGIYKAIENLLNEKAEKNAEEQIWKERERSFIGGRPGRCEWWSCGRQVRGG